MKNRVRKPGRQKKERIARHKRVLHVAHATAYIIVWTALASVIVQVVYPAHRTIPFARIDGVEVSMVDRGIVIERLNEIAEKAELTVVTPDKTRKVPWASIGITIDREATAKSLVRYEWWERLVPFSLLARMAYSHHTPLTIVDKERLEVFAETIAKEDQKAAKGASIEVVEGEVRIDEAKAGYVFEAETVAERLQSTPFASEGEVTLAPKVMKAKREREEVVMVATQAESVLNRTLVLEFAGHTITPDQRTIGRWLKVKEDQATRQLELVVDRGELKEYLKDINKKHAVPPGVSYVTLLDGVEVSRTNGPQGRAMNVETTSKNIEMALLGSLTPKVSIPIEELAPSISYKRTYSEASSGLQALLRDWEKNTYGDFGVVIREIGGRNRYAEWQPDKSFVTASTYKMFLAYVVLSKMEDGKINGNTPTDMGWTVDACLNEMIVNSTNPCATSLQNLVGWEETDRMVHAAGFDATFLNNLHGNDKLTTVRDEANFLLKLESGVLMNQQSTTRLMDLLKRQIWRGGIPQGVPAGTVVANKVGFYNGWVHDVAIVYGPRSAYILAIMSRGGSDPGFADLSQKVYNFFAR